MPTARSSWTCSPTVSGSPRMKRAPSMALVASSSVVQLMPIGARRWSTLATAASIVAPRKSDASAVLLMVAMSRSKSAQCAARTSILRGSSSKPAVKFAISACSAMRRRVFFSPCPPIMIGGPPGVIGAGLLMASSTRWCLPSNVGRSPRNMPRQITSASARRSKRSFTGGKSTPRALCSTSYQAAPMPRNARPLEITSRVVTILARSAGLRYVTPVTSVPSLTFVVRAARAPSSV